MKTFSFLLTLLALISQLDARDNPFEPTRVYQDEIQRMIEVEPEQEFMEKKDSEYEYSSKAQKQKAVAKTAKQIQDTLNAKRKISMAKKKEKELAMKLKTLEADKLKAKNNPMIYVKMRKDVIVDKKIDILPFINIEYTNTQLKIHSKYKVFKKFYLEEGNKLVLDFRGYTTFYTRHYDLEANVFSKFSVGNHKKDRFFRVVIALKEQRDKYEITYDENIVLVTFRH